MTVVLAILSAFVLGGFTVYSFGGKFIVKRHFPALLDLMFRADKATEKIEELQQEQQRILKLATERDHERLKFARQLEVERDLHIELNRKYDILLHDHEILQNKYDVLCQEKVIEAWARDFARRDES